MEKVFSIGFSILGSVEIQAKSQEEAKKKLSEMGIQELIECNLVYNLLKGLRDFYQANNFQLANVQFPWLLNWV